jgi:facilitated trehalose transporter
MFFSGTVTISFYAVDVFRMATSGVDQYLSAIVIGIIKLIGTVLFVPAVRYYSRRLLLCLSSLVMGLSLLVLAVFMYARENGGSMGETFESLYWLPLCCVTFYIIADALGLGSIPFLYVGEFFPSEMRSVMSGLTIGKLAPSCICIFSRNDPG